MKNRRPLISTQFKYCTKIYRRTFPLALRTETLIVLYANRRHCIVLIYVYIILPLHGRQFNISIVFVTILMRWYWVINDAIGSVLT